MLIFGKSHAGTDSAEISPYELKSTREGERQTHRQTETETDIYRQIQTQTQKDREREKTKTEIWLDWFG